MFPSLFMTWEGIFKYIFCLHQWFPKCKPAAPLGNFLEMQNLRFHPKLSRSETLREESSELCFNKPSWRFWCTFHFENPGFQQAIYIINLILKPLYKNKEPCNVISSLLPGWLAQLGSTVLKLVTLIRIWWTRSLLSPRMWMRKLRSGLLLLAVLHHEGSQPEDKVHHGEMQKERTAEKWT